MCGTHPQLRHISLVCFLPQSSYTVVKALMDSKRILMIVDDTPNVGRALSRVLGRYFDEVHPLTSASEAAALLGQMPVTHVICDYCLGDGDPPGVELVPRWRREHPSIERAVILTGLDPTTLLAGPGIDAVVSKLADTEELVRIVKGS